MGMANIQEKLMFFVKQKSAITLQLSEIQMQQLSATRSSAQQQMEYNQILQDLYYDENYGYGTDEYAIALRDVQNEHQFEMASLTAWESQLEAQKDELETQLNEVQSYENAFMGLLKANIKSEFTFGGINK